MFKKVLELTSVVTPTQIQKKTVVSPCKPWFTRRKPDPFSGLWGLGGVGPPVAAGTLQEGNFLQDSLHGVPGETGHQIRIEQPTSWQNIIPRNPRIQKSRNPIVQKTRNPKKSGFW